ncbi:quinone oxidoreductase family protein [Tanticharoenia sakaeratensis]|uniref:Quinone oxidoreductase n=1 Tax=Tanticharoenia sakaeratensis NBRC 103193 TaxID=1231623 RepID=A0A0D6MPS7_9PROT|nr:quinone oxidoreductase [Tanticharoenia sakaeratensis]GAN55709.1 quinone oxidoreductase [Tanticharoenia sakaeratensis NBRC 103193]GBQ22743.1 quinone oxidoreductase [Tanticharoenia sakaeratensis NBRC 103193]
MQAIRVHETGDADRLTLKDVPPPEPADGQSLVQVHYAGINYTEVYQRSGVTRVTLPSTPGSEGVGVIMQSTRFPVGTRVGWVGVPGAYAEAAVVPDHRLVALPDDVSDETAAAILLQGITAQYLAEDSYAPHTGDVAVVHAAARGVGLLLTQLLVAKGVTVIGTTSTDAKAVLAQKAGAAQVIRYDRDDVAAAVRATHPDGVQVVYDSVGQATWNASLRALRRRGTLVLYGHASGKVAPIDPMLLAQRGSLTLTRPLIGDFIATQDALQARADRLFGWLRDGTLRPSITQTYTLADTAQAHRDLEARRTSGKLLLRIIQ